MICELASDLSSWSVWKADSSVSQVTQAAQCRFVPTPALSPRYDNSNNLRSYFGVASLVLYGNNSPRKLNSCPAGSGIAELPREDGKDAFD